MLKRYSRTLFLFFSLLPLTIGCAGNGVPSGDASTEDQTVLVTPDQQTAATDVSPLHHDVPPVIPEDTQQTVDLLQPDVLVEPDQGEADTAVVTLCAGVTCGTNAVCKASTGQCVCNSGTTGDPNLACEPVVELSGFIGSPCETHSDCPYSGGFCMTEGEGYSGGHCSVACDKFCPDKDGYPVTFCIAVPGDTDGHCFSQCDLQAYPGNGGCRAGYSCRSWPRVTDPATVKKVCVPSEWSGQIVEPKCSDPANLDQDDECYLDLVSYGNTQLRELTLKLLQGSATSADALNWLDLNHLLSQTFIETKLNVTIHNNYTAGHSASKPMRGMIVHYTAAQSEDSTIKYFVGAEPHASTHFIIGSKRNGLIVQLFSHKNRTWHAGNTYNIDRFGFDFANAGFLKPSGNGFVDYYDKIYAMVYPVFGNEPVTITDGIPEPNTPKNKYTGNKYWQPYSYYQVLSWITVARALNLVYGLQYEAIERHGDVAASRVDPGPALPLTFMKPLVFSDDPIWGVSWLNDYKWKAEWIELHPEAR